MVSEGKTQDDSEKRAGTSATWAAEEVATDRQAEDPAPAQAVVSSRSNGEPTVSGAIEPAPQEALPDGRGEKAVPEQLVSEEDVENEVGHDLPIAEPATSAEVTESEARTRRLIAGLEGQGFAVESDGKELVLQLPAGRSNRSIYLSLDQAEDALAIGLNGWRSLERFDGVWNQADGLVEVALRGERFGMPPSRMLEIISGKRTVLGEEQEAQAIELSDGSSSVHLRIASASKVAALFVASGRFRPVRPPLTLSISPVRIASTSDADSLVEKLSDSISLQLGMRSGMLLTPRRLEARGVARALHRRRGGALTFPTSSYPHAPVALYQAGRERNTSPLLRYWAFYQVLEYFFPTYVRTDSLSRIARIVRSPTFDPHDDQDLLRVASVAADSGGGRVGEEDQLLLCLRAVTSVNEIRDFVLECGLKERLIDKKSPLSSKTVNIDAQEDCIAQLAKRIYDIRCRIVHSKYLNQREEGPGLLPGTEDEDLVRYELPLVDFLAEQALAAAAVRLDMRSIELVRE